MEHDLSNERGMVIPLVLTIMVVGAIILTGLFLALNASQRLLGKDQQVVETYYAADSGIELALSQLRDVVYATGFSGSEDFEPYELNASTVSVTLDSMGSLVYKITSTATSTYDSTTIETYVLLHDYSFFFDGAITSNNNVVIRPGSSVTGNVTYTGQLTGQQYIDGNISHVSAIEPWPTGQFFSDFYWDDVKHLQPFSNSIIDVQYTQTIGPLYRNGSLDISSSQDGASAQLNGTVYVGGSSSELRIGQTGKDFTLDLNDQAIYCEGSIVSGGKVTFTGSGMIIAVGNIDFQPNMQSEPGDFIFVLSIEGTTNFQPNGDFYGSLAGDVCVNLQPGCILTWVDIDENGVNFSSGNSAKLEVLAYNVD